MKNALLAFVASLSLALSACGNTAQERMLTGGLIGAGIGAFAGAATTPEPRPRYRR